MSLAELMVHYYKSNAEYRAYIDNFMSNYDHADACEHITLIDTEVYYV